MPAYPPGPAAEGNARPPARRSPTTPPPARSLRSTGPLGAEGLVGGDDEGGEDRNDPIRRPFEPPVGPPAQLRQASQGEALSLSPLATCDTSRSDGAIPYRRTRNVGSLGGQIRRRRSFVRSASVRPACASGASQSMTNLEPRPGVWYGCKPVRTLVSSGVSHRTIQFVHAVRRTSDPERVTAARH